MCTLFLCCQVISLPWIQMSVWLKLQYSLFFFLRPSCQRRERVASLETQERSKRRVYISHSSNPNITNLPVYLYSERFKWYVFVFLDLHVLTHFLFVFCVVISPVSPGRRRCQRIRTGHRSIQQPPLSDQAPSPFLFGWVTLWREACLQRRRATWS